MPLPSTPRDLQIEVLNGVTYQYNASLNAWIRYKSTTANVITTDTANVVSNISSTSTTTGALKVAGGAGIVGNVFAGAVYTNSYFYANGAAFAGAGGGGVGFTGSAGSTGFTGSAGTIVDFSVYSGIFPSIFVDGNNAADTTYDGTVWKEGTTSAGKGYEQGGMTWNATTGNVTVPHTGLYQVSWTAYHTASGSETHNQRFELRKNGASLISPFSHVGMESVTTLQHTVTTTINLNANDTISIAGVATASWRPRIFGGSSHTYLQVVKISQVGYTGSTGAAGANGFTGSQGTGFTGSTGTTGFAGSFGTTGFAGSTGFTGSTGVGFAGSAGFTGSTGTGFTGSAGVQGAIGYTGSAGTGGGGGGGYTGSQGIPGTLASGQATNTFTGDGTTTAFTLSVAPVSKDAVTVNIDGVTQQRSGFSVSGFVLTLDEAPLSGEVIEVTIATYGTTNFVTRTYTGNGTTANYAVTLGATVDSVIVTENGVVQTPTSDYTISGNVLSFVGGAPAAGTAIGIREIPAGAVGGNSVYSRTAITATANQTSFAVAYTVGFLEVYFNGALLNAVDYTATNGSTVVLTDPAADGDIVEFITYNVVPVTAVPVATFNSTNLTANLAITAGYSAVSVGPINIANGVTISIADGQKWVIL